MNETDQYKFDNWSPSPSGWFLTRDQRTIRYRRSACLVKVRRSGYVNYFADFSPAAGNLRAPNRALAVQR